MHTAVCQWTEPGQLEQYGRLNNYVNFQYGACVILQEADDPMLPNTKQLLHKNSFVSLINHFDVL